MIPDVVHAPSITRFFLELLWYGTPKCCTSESLDLTEAESFRQQSSLNPGTLFAVKPLTEIMCEVKRVEKLQSVRTTWNSLLQCNTRSVENWCSDNVCFFQKSGYWHWHSEFPRRPCSESPVAGFWGVHMEILLVSQDKCTFTSKTKWAAERYLDGVLRRHGIHYYTFNAKAAPNYLDTFIWTNVCRKGHTRMQMQNWHLSAKQNYII